MFPATIQGLCVCILTNRCVGAVLLLAAREKSVVLSLRDDAVICRSSDVCDYRAATHSTAKPVAVSSEDLKDLKLCHESTDEGNKLLIVKVTRNVCRNNKCT